MVVSGGQPTAVGIDHGGRWRLHGGTRWRPGNFSTTGGGSAVAHGS